MYLCSQVRALNEVRLLVSSAQSVHDVHTRASTFRSNGASRSLADVLLAMKIVLVPEIAAEAVMIVLKNDVHAVLVIR